MGGCIERESKERATWNAVECMVHREMKLREISERLAEEHEYVSRQKRILHQHHLEEATGSRHAQHQQSEVSTSCYPADLEEPEQECMPEECSRGGSILSSEAEVLPIVIRNTTATVHEALLNFDEGGWWAAAPTEEVLGRSIIKDDEISPRCEHFRMYSFSLDECPLAYDVDVGTASPSTPRGRPSLRGSLSGNTRRRQRHPQRQTRGRVASVSQKSCSPHDCKRSRSPVATAVDAAASCL